MNATEHVNSIFGLSSIIKYNYGDKKIFSILISVSLVEPNSYYRKRKSKAS